MNQNKLTTSFIKMANLMLNGKKIKLAKTGNTKSEDRFV